MKYIVTLGVFDHTVEGNPGWHSAIWASIVHEDTKQVEIVDTWGFYGAPRTGAKESLVANIVRGIGLNLDLDYNPGNHGWLTHEEVRYMHLGHGLHGRSFELTEEKFNQLLGECAKRIADQEAAVKEVLGDKEFSTTKKVRHYSGEQFSRYIYTIEKAKAEMEDRPSRLKPFDFDLAFAPWRPWKPITFQASHTCKTQALDILKTVLPEEALAPYYASTFPRLVTTGMEKIILYSEGPLDTHTKSSGETIYFRKKETPGVKMFWAVPPQIQPIDALPDSDTVSLLTVDEEYCAQVKKLVGQLIRIEWLLRNAQVSEEYQEYQTRLILRVVEHYKAFSVLEPLESKKEKVSGWMGFFYSVAELPKSLEQQNLQTKIRQAKFLLNSLYMATDGWTIESGRSPEPVSLSEATGEENALEALVAYLSVKDKMKLCTILERTYCEPRPTLSATMN